MGNEYKEWLIELLKIIFNDDSDIVDRQVVQNAYIRLSANKERLDKALECVDIVFQDGYQQNKKAILGNFLNCGDDKFEGVIDLAHAYKSQVEKNKELVQYINDLLDYQEKLNKQLKDKLNE